MFWIVAPIVAVGVVAAIMSSASEGERVARRNWESKREEVKKTVEEHRMHLEELEPQDHTHLVDDQQHQEDDADDKEKALMVRNDQFGGAGTSGGPS